MLKLLGLILLVSARPAVAAPLTLAEALARVMAAGPDRAVARAAIPVAEAEVKTARMFPNPAISVAAARSEPLVSASLAFRLPIFGQRGAQVDAAKRGVDAATAKVRSTLWQLRRSTRDAYYALERDQEEVSIAIELEQLTGRVAAIAAERFREGAGPRLERDQAALIHARALADITDRRAAAAVSLLELARLLGTSPAALGEPSDALASVGATPPLERLLAEASVQHPELRELDAERAWAEARAHAARAERRPTPTVELGAELLDPATCGGASRCVGPRGALTLDLPLFNWNGGPIASAQAAAHLAEVQRRAAALQIETAVQTAYRQLTAAIARAHFFDRQYVPAAISVEKMATEGFSAGKTGLLPLIEAERAVLEARIGRADALYAVQAARADLEEASGVALSAP